MLNAVRRPSRLSVTAVILSIAAAACGGGDTTQSSGEGATGGVEISGSSTVAPISTRVAELFAEAGSDVSVNVDGPGTGDGFALFCDGQTDISDASRPIKAEEAATCASNNIEYIELKVAIDGLSVIGNEANELDCLNFADLYALAGPESQGIDSWAEAGDIASELGSETDLPDTELLISAPGEESGTYDSFVEIVIETYSDDREAEAETRPDYQSSGDDNVILQGIQGAPGSFGWVGYAFAREAEGIKSFEIAAEPGGECVAPTDETISSGDYPIARDLYIYVSVEALAAKPAVEEYVDFYLSEEGLEAVPEVGYVELGAEDLEATRSVWEAKEAGTRDGGS